MTIFFKCLCKAQDRILAAQYRQDGHEVVNIKLDIARRTEARRLAKAHGLNLPIAVDNETGNVWEV